MKTCQPFAGFATRHRVRELVLATARCGTATVASSTCRRGVNNPRNAAAVLKPADRGFAR